MEPSKVFFTDFRTTKDGGLTEKLKKLCRKAGITDIDFENKLTAIKMHFGEDGNLSFLRPEYARAGQPGLYPPELRRSNGSSVTQLRR